MGQKVFRAIKATPESLEPQVFRDLVTQVRRVQLGRRESRDPLEFKVVLESKVCGVSQELDPWEVQAYKVRQV
jgi:hypothetical protein